MAIGTPARRAARWGRLWGCTRQSDAKHRFAGLGRHRRQCRRAERHGYHSLTARHSRDLLMISGRVDYVTTPAPLALPPEHTPRGVISIPCAARARGSSCGSFLPSLRSVRRSPSAPRKWHSPLSLWAESASAEYPNYALCIEAGYALHSIHKPRRIRETDGLDKCG